MKSLVIASSFLSHIQPFMGEYPVSLLEVGGKSVIDMLLQEVDEIDEVDGHLIVTNEVCYPFMKAWLMRTHYKKPITLIHDEQVCDLASSNPMCEIVYVIERYSLQEELLVLSGSIVLEGSIVDFVEQARKKRSSCMVYYRESLLNALKEGASVVFDKNQKVIAIHVKPQVPSSRWGVASFLYLCAADVVRLYKVVAEGTAFDSPLEMLSWLGTVSELYAWELTGYWFNIKDASTLEEADNFYKNVKART